MAAIWGRKGTVSGSSSPSLHPLPSCIHLLENECHGSSLPGSQLKPWWVSYSHKPNPAHGVLLQIKLSWTLATPICFWFPSSPFDCVNTRKAELSHCDRSSTGPTDGKTRYLTHCIKCLLPAKLQSEPLGNMLPLKALPSCSAGSTQSSPQQVAPSSGSLGKTTFHSSKTGCRRRNCTHLTVISAGAKALLSTAQASTEQQ